MCHIKTRAVEHLEQLCVEIGPRALGSKGNEAAADYIRTVFEAAGLEVELQNLRCPAWEEIFARLEFDGEELPAVANTFSPPCECKGSLVAAGTVAELESADLAGRIGVMYGDLTRGTGYGARSAYYYPERDRKIVGILESKRPAALITVNAKPASTERLMRDWDFAIPSVTVSAGVGLRLLRARGGELRLQIRSQRSTGQFCNVVGRKAGSRPRQVIVMAHFDTMEDTPGAGDNGSGVAALLGLAERLAASEPGLSLECVALNGEEVGGLGDAEYLRRRQSDLSQALVAINLDGVGQRVGVNSITTMGCSDEFQTHVRQVHNGYPGVAWGDPWFESDHTAFLNQGVPCVPITSVGVGSVFHSPADTIEWISPEKLDEVVSLVRDIVESIGDKTPEWCRETTEGEQ
jgi:Iap family predicted aminopeptidase